jgi:putative salt-induced outer membrane protein YdiY
VNSAPEVKRAHAAALANAASHAQEIDRRTATSALVAALANAANHALEVTIGPIVRSAHAEASANATNSAPEVKRAHAAALANAANHALAALVSAVSHAQEIDRRTATSALREPEIAERTNLVKSAQEAASRPAAMAQEKRPRLVTTMALALPALSTVVRPATNAPLPIRPPTKCLLA